MKKISIIIPVFNTGEILGTTINSILGQTYCDWELILVDDGSTDGSGAVCDAYAAQDERIRVFHKSNGGISSARNYGMERAEGEYLAFCDHDDEYFPELIERGVESMERYGVDVVAYRYSYIYDDGRIVDSSMLSKCDVVVGDVGGRFCELYDRGFLDTVWSMVYKMSFLKKTGLRFDESFRCGGEDINFNACLVEEGFSCVFLHDLLYRHYLRGGLSTSARHHPENTDLHLRHLVRYDAVLRALSKKPDAEQIKWYCRTFRRLSRLYLSNLTKSDIGYEDFGSECIRVKSLMMFKDNFTHAFSGDASDVAVGFLLKSGRYRILYHILNLHNRKYHAKR